MTSKRFALGVHLDLRDGDLADNWFHLAPGIGRRIAVRNASGLIMGEVRAVNSRAGARFE